MGLVNSVNRLLAPMDVALTRRTTLDRTREQLQLALTQQVDVAAQTHIDYSVLADALAPAIGALDELRRQHAALLNQQEEIRRQQSAQQREVLRHQIASRWNVVDAVARHVVTPARRACPLCGHAGDSMRFGVLRSHCIFGGGVLTRHQCPACDVIFGPDKMFDMTEHELTQEYEWHYKVYEEGDSTEAEIRAFHSLAPRRDGIYVNFGAGAWSKSVQQLRADGWNVFAYEPHSSAAPSEDWSLNSETQIAALRVDGLFSNNVLEHLRHPAADLRRMAGWLKPGALMAHATPCYEYLYEYTRFHLYFFPGRSRELLADLAGLKIQSYEVDGHFMNCVFQPQKANEGAMR